MNLNEEFWRRWGLPLALSAVALGAWAGATQYRFGSAASSAAATPFNPVRTTTATVTATAAAPPAETRVVRETVTLTPRTPAPQTVVREVPPVTVVKTVSPDPETETKTVTKEPTVSEMLEAVTRNRGRN